MKVLSVTSGSAAEAAGVEPGDDLAAIGGVPVRDSLDVAYALGWMDDETEVAPFEFERGGVRFAAELRPARPATLGLELAGDTYRTCPNRCVFCFVDQLPRGLRESLSVKDEDFRLSFAFGNYITLTNLTDADYERIGRQRLSPLYVSVHATDDAVRRDLLRNSWAPAILDSLRRLGDLGVAVHAQIVIVPGVNDGPVLERTLDDLTALDCVSSVAVVPVGLTSHRRGLPKIEPVSRSLAGDVVGRIELRQERLLRARGSRTVFAVDELYLLAGADLPPLEAYEDFPQVEDGVGMLRALERDFTERVPELEGRVTRPTRLIVVTGTSAAPFLRALVPPALAAAGPMEVSVIGVTNSLLGPSVTVAGLLGGADMAGALRSAPDSDLVLLPGEAFNADGLTLDGMTVTQIAGSCGGWRVVATREIIGTILDHLDSQGGERWKETRTSA